MDEVIIENYLGNIQGVEPDYMTEGIREFMGKFDKITLKRTAEKIYSAFSKGDKKSLDQVVRSTARIGKLPKTKEVKEFMGNFEEETPQLKASTDLARKVLRNTFKVKNKTKLEIMSYSVSLTAWLKSKGGRYDMMKMTKDTLREIHTKTMHIYDTGFDDLETKTEEEEERKKKMLAQAKNAERMEMALMGVILFVLVAAMVGGGIAIWVAISGTTAAATAVGTTMTLMTFLFYITMGAFAIVVPLYAFLKMFQLAGGL
jgi:hypothetical protein